MTRARSNVISRRRRKKLLKEVRGARGGRSKLIRTAMENLRRARKYAYRDRRRRKREFRGLWISRINAAARTHDLSYSRFMAGLGKAGVDLDRRVLAELAVNHPEDFGRLAEVARDALE